MTGSSNRGQPPPAPRARHRSRAASTASRQLSVPPLVTVPTVAASPPSSAAAAPTRSFSIRATLGKAVGSSAFVHW